MWPFLSHFRQFLRLPKYGFCLRTDASFCHLYFGVLNQIIWWETKTNMALKYLNMHIICNFWYPEAKLQCRNSWYWPDWEYNQFLVWVVDLTRINSADLELQLTINQREHIPFSLSTVDAAPIKDLTPDCRCDEKVISCHFFGEPPLFCQARGPKKPLSNSGQQWPSVGNGVKNF